MQVILSCVCVYWSLLQFNVWLSKNASEYDTVGTFEKTVL